MADIQKLNVNGNTYDISTTWAKVTGKPATFTPSSHTHSYLPLSGGTLTGSVTMNGIDTNLIRNITHYATTGWARDLITLKVDDVRKFAVSAFGSYTSGATDNGITFAYLGMDTYNGTNLRIYGTGTNSIKWGDNNLLHAGNYNSYAPTLTGTGASGTWGINISGNASTATSATTATKLSSNAGSSTNPIYFSGGKPVACSYSLNKTVPSNAVFTDTNTWRPVTNTYTGSDQSTCVSQYGTNALYNALVNGYASSAGTATYASRLGDSNAYYTKSSLDTALAGKANSSHGTHLSGSAALYSNSSSGSNCNDVTYNLIGYYSSRGPSTSLGASTNDGTLYSQAYSSSWVSQIAQDYRNGNLFTRGKNNGTWTAWKAVSYNGHTHTKSQITDFPTSMPASDVYSWAKASTKPTYTYSEVGAAPASHTHSYLPLSGGTLSGDLSMERSKIYWNGDIEGSYISSHGMTEMTYEMRDGHRFCVNGDIKLRITRFGNVLINGSANATTLYENGTRVALSGHTHSYLPLSGGTVSGTITATGFYQSSDERLKTFYDPIKVDLDKLSKLRKNYFKFKDKDKLEIGVSAQEIQSIYPEIVSENSDGYLSVAYDKLSVIALAAIDEQQNIINEQNNKINQLEERLKAIENILSKLTS